MVSVILFDAYKHPWFESVARLHPPGCPQSGARLSTPGSAIAGGLTCERDWGPLTSCTTNRRSPPGRSNLCIRARVGAAFRRRVMARSIVRRHRPSSRCSSTSTAFALARRHQRRRQPALAPTSSSPTLVGGSVGYEMAPFEIGADMSYLKNDPSDGYRALDAVGTEADAKFLQYGVRAVDSPAGNDPSYLGVVAAYNLKDQYERTAPASTWTRRTGVTATPASTLGWSLVGPRPRVNCHVFTDDSSTHTTRHPSSRWPRLRFRLSPEPRSAPYRPPQLGRSHDGPRTTGCISAEHGLNGRPHPVPAPDRPLAYPGQCAPNLYPSTSQLQYASCNDRSTGDA
jgi:hypothetical protein